MKRNDEKAIERLLAGLDRLGVDATVELLLRLGIRGQRCNSRRCPLAIYLHRKLHGEYDVSRYEVYCFSADGNRVEGRWQLPPRVSAFVRSFDAIMLPSVSVDSPLYDYAQAQT